LLRQILNQRILCLIRKWSDGLIDFVVFDFETTGLNTQLDVPIEVGYWHDGMAHSMRVHQTRPISPEASAVHGITDAMCVDGVAPESYLETLIEVLFDSDCAIITHNGIKFDIPMLEVECERYGYAKPDRSRYIDTAAMYKGIKLGIIAKAGESHWDYATRVLGIHSYQKFNLTHVANELGILWRGASHGAAADANMTAQIFMRLLDYSNVGI
jgi:DNA polymerase III epsilon subunit-like protein